MGIVERGRFGRALSALRAGFALTRDFALPPLCAACREPIGTGAGLCSICWSNLSLIEPPYCPRLGTPFAYDPGPGVLSLEAIADPPAYERARAVARYDDVAGRLVHALKYNDRLDLAPVMGRWMARAARDLLDGADGLVPVPLHWRRLWARRFNQSAVLARQISQQNGVPVLTESLRRKRSTRQQVGLSKGERASNVQGAFTVTERGKADVVGRRLILIDDVLTSGATAEACARALVRAGAAQVDVLVFARVVGMPKSPI